MLRFVPIPELVIVLALASLVFGPRTLRRLMQSRRHGRTAFQGGRFGELSKTTEITEITGVTEKNGR
jgi:Sec-independent protein translocase protein TatA